MKTLPFRYFLLFILLFGLGSWGEKAHQKVNSSCVRFFPPELQKLNYWAPILAEHASDPDLKRKTDKTEFVRHFIDLDNYPEFIETRKIPQDYHAACLKYGLDMVKKNGTLPWTTDSTYQALVLNFKQKDWETAVLTAANLGHYVADGFMPLHCSANYDGQLSNQKGIHSRYEEKMIDRYIDQIQFSETKPAQKDLVKPEIFSYIYSNFKYVDLLLKADLKAYDQAGKQFSDEYYSILWEESKSFTIRLLEESSKTLASLIYSAWLEAGKPELPSETIQN